MKKLNISTKTKDILKVSIVVLVTSFMRAVAMAVFIAPSKIAPGGVGGIAAILYNATGFNMAYTNILLNLPLLLLAFLFINKKYIFVIGTLCFNLLTSGFIYLIQALPANNFLVFEGETIVAAICAGLLTGCCIGALLKVNCSTGGTDVISLLLQSRFPNAKIVWMTFVIDFCIALAGAVVFRKLGLLIYSLIAMFTSTFTADMLQRSFLATQEFKIITDKPKEVADFILEKINRDVTVFDATGYYTGLDKKCLVCIVRKRQGIMLKNSVKSIDPKAFFYVVTVTDVIGNGFNNKVTPATKFKTSSKFKLAQTTNTKCQQKKIKRHTVNLLKSSDAGLEGQNVKETADVDTRCNCGQDSKK